VLRGSFTWVVPAAVIAVGVFAGLDALRSSGGEPTASAPSATEALTTTQTERDAVLGEWSARLQTRRVVRLIHGRVSAELFSPSPVVTFMVPPGWYGYQDETGFVLGMGLVGEEVDLVPGGITVYVLGSALADAARRLEQVKGIRVKSPIRIGESLGRRYAGRLGLHRDVTLNDLGAPVVVPPSPDLILLGAGRKTLVIRRAFTTDLGRAQVNGVLSSFRFPSLEQEIEQTSNEWAPLFAGDRHTPAPGTCQHMTQPGCERMNCERVGSRPIRNCTRPSWQFRKSFADATVVAIVIKGHQADARFSNGETVRLEIGVGGSWWIDGVGAGRQFFE
jgi:hypothetical protein